MTDPFIPRGVAPNDGMSHVSGVTDRPLSTATISALLVGTAAKWPDRDAVVFREQGMRWTWAQFKAEVDRFAAGLSSLGLQPGDRLGIWSPNRVEWLVTQFATARIGVILVNINPAYRLAELEYALNASGCRAIVSAERLRTLDVPRDAASTRARTEQRRAGRAEVQAPADAPARDPPGARADTRHAGLRRGDGARRCVPRRCRARRDRCDARLLRRHQHPVHQRNDRQSQGRHAHAPQRRQQRSLCRAGHALRRARLAVHPGAAVPLLRHGSVGARVRVHRRDHGVPGGGLRPRGDARGSVRRKVHGAARRADDVHRRTRPSAVRAVRPVDAAHRHHGRRAVPDRDDEARHRADEHARGDDRLRYDRDEPGVVPELDHRSARAARVDRRPHPASPAGQGRRRQRQHGARSGSPANCGCAATR